VHELRFDERVQLGPVGLSVPVSSMGQGDSIPIAQRGSPSETQAVTKPAIGAEIMLFRPLKRAGDVLTFPQSQSRDWGYPMPPADAG
jgi:hypothetical protein